MNSTIPVHNNYIKFTHTTSNKIIVFKRYDLQLLFSIESEILKLFSIPQSHSHFQHTHD